MPKLQIGELEVHYQQAGTGPDVVLIHAFTSNLAIWMLTGIVDRLSQNFRVTLYDLRGHGLTTATQHGYQSGQLADDFFAIQDALSLDPCLLVGHSYGGVVALRAAAENPDRVRGVILCDCYFSGLADLEPAMSRSEPWRDLAATLAELNIPLSDTVDFQQLFQIVAALDDRSRDALNAKLGPAGVRWLTQMSQLADTHAAVEMFEVDGFTHQRICEVTIPVVALYDEFTPFSATREHLRNNLTDCVVDTVPGAKHLAPVENTRAFVDRIEVHLDRLVNKLS